MEQRQLPEGVEFEIVIQKTKTGGIVVNALMQQAEVVRSVLIQAVINLNQEMIVNDAFVRLVDYLSNSANQNAILQRVAGKKPS